MRPCHRDRCKTRGTGRPVGFTLIEVLTAMTILVLIIMMVSAMFNQFRMAWRSGMMRTAKNCEARAVLDFMAQELTASIADPALACDIKDGASEVGFFALGTGDDRVVGYAKYKLESGVLKRGVARTISYASFPAKLNPPSPVMQSVMADVKELRFATSTGDDYTTNLPQWVEIEMTVVPNSARLENVDAWSVGKDGKDGTKDDINRPGI